MAPAQTSRRYRGARYLVGTEEIDGFLLLAFPFFCSQLVAFTVRRGLYSPPRIPRGVRGQFEVDCPKSGLGQVRPNFFRPGPGAQWTRAREARPGPGPIANFIDNFF